MGQSLSSHEEVGAADPVAQRKEGWLSKESETLKAWNPRYCILEKRVLSYWDSEAEQKRGDKPRAVVSLANSRVSLFSGEGDPDRLGVRAIVIEAPNASSRGQTTMYFQATTEADLQEWLEVLQIASREPWKTGEVAACPSCRLISFDLLNRQHHCRRCGTQCCAVCSEGKQALPFYRYDEPVRVCRDCYGEEGPAPTAAQKAQLASDKAAAEARRAAAANQEAKAGIAAKRATEAEERKARIKEGIAARAKKS